MSTVDIVLLVLVAAIVVVVVVGIRIARRRQEAGEATLSARLGQANDALAQAHAADKGWDRALMERAARQAGGAHGDHELRLVQVIDRPGTEADEALFHAVGADGHVHEVRLGREGDGWVPR